MAGTKTVTRRMPSANPRSPWWEGRCALVPGREYAVQPGRGVPSIGRVRVLSTRKRPLGWLTADEARAEGFESASAFAAVWRELNGDYSDRQLVWCIEFELVGDSE